MPFFYMMVTGAHDVMFPLQNTTVQEGILEILQGLITFPILNLSTFLHTCEEIIKTQISHDTGGDFFLLHRSVLPLHNILKIYIYQIFVVP